MKKLFLTSGLVLCMAGQASASTPITYGGSPAAYGNSGCNETYLDTYQAPASLEAIWNANISGQITLDSNRYETSSDSTASSTATTQAADASVFSKYQTAMYGSLEDAQAGTNAITGLSTTPVMTGYTFQGFYTGKAGTGTQVIGSNSDYTVDAVEQISTANQTATWYAHWSPKTATINFDNKRYASVSDSEGTSTGITTAGTSSVVTRYEHGVYADSTTAAAMTPTISSITAPVMTGYTFGGYWTNKDGTGTQYVSNSGGTLINNLDEWKNGEAGNTAGTLYAKWTANSCNITYNATTHSASPSATFTDNNTGPIYDSPYSIPEAAVTLSAAASGYTFVGWTTDSTPNVTRTTATSGTVANPWTWTNGATWTETSCPVTVYAAYIANQYTISYNCGAPKTGSTSVVNQAVTGVVAAGSVPVSQTIATGENYTLRANTCTLAGYGFAGWDCKTSGSVALTGTPGVSYTDYDGTTQSTIFAAGATGTFNNAADVTCTAKWTQNEINLTWRDGYSDTTNNPNADVISVDQSSQSCDYDGNIVLPSAPSRPGYQFSGWTVSSTSPSSGS